jgi:hypothetical protein
VRQAVRWQVRVSSYSTIVGHRIGWQRADDSDRTFRFRSMAERYATDMTGVISIFVPFMSFKSEIVRLECEPDWIDRVLWFLGVTEVSDA